MIIMVTGVTFFILRLIIGEKKDTWICREGEWIRHGQPAETKPKENCNSDNTTTQMPKTPREITENFYKWYAGSETNPLTSGSYKISNYITDGLKEKTGRDLAGSDRNRPDPFLCILEKPQQIKIFPEEQNKETATVRLEEKTDKKINSYKIILKLTEGEWKIDEIKCREPLEQQDHPRNNP